MSASLPSLNSESPVQIVSGNVETNETCLGLLAHPKAIKLVKTVVQALVFTLSIIFVVVGALGLAGSASLPLLIIGSVVLGIAAIGFIVALISMIVLKVYLNRAGL
ncbi:hypothetical protein C834K_0586 [Chlamydia poikilotherma]|uniref:Uncharacterized protein n=1 Tax=Chlamydia poikilotherma TaxID=1967783 RepID=A0A3B0PPQ7_9CHLA|nr:hypothetical protein [Chlamydia poikilotherma]SYX09040.1 hypothetical protein C834K_0586 [Chlamydia poikilotherma]